MKKLQVRWRQVFSTHCWSDVPWHPAWRPLYERACFRLHRSAGGFPIIETDRLTGLAQPVTFVDGQGYLSDRHELTVVRSCWFTLAMKIAICSLRRLNVPPANEASQKSRQGYAKACFRKVRPAESLCDTRTHNEPDAPMSIRAGERIAAGRLLAGRQTHTPLLGF